jgi:uncharacterized protein (UPF0548 family)
MTLWRFGRGWPRQAMRGYLAALAARPLNFTEDTAAMTAAHGWTKDGAQVSLGFEAPGAPVAGGLFTTARRAVLDYEFSDPRIVEGHFDAKAAFVGRNLLLELKVLGFHFLTGVRVHSLRDETSAGVSTFGFRYDTLEGHIERGYEWFLLTKDHRSGEVHFNIEAVWRLGDFPNWWMRLGFALLGRPIRVLWRHMAPRRLQAYVARNTPTDSGGIVSRVTPLPEASAKVQG